jgi:hypothetical protein
MKDEKELNDGELMEGMCNQSNQELEAYFVIVD